jgi:hypothetical protein
LKTQEYQYAAIAPVAEDNCLLEMDERIPIHNKRTGINEPETGGESA